MNGESLCKLCATKNVQLLPLSPHAAIIIIIVMENPLRFDVLVNGGGAITLQFQRSPFRPMTRTVFVPWNQVNYHNDIVIKNLMLPHTLSTRGRNFF
jgi:hypothetical protein